MIRPDGCPRKACYMKQVLPYIDDYRHPLPLVRSAKKCADQGSVIISPLEAVHNARLYRFVIISALISTVCLGCAVCVSLIVHVYNSSTLAFLMMSFVLAIGIALVVVCADPLTQRYARDVRRINRIIRDYNSCNCAPEIREVLVRELVVLEDNMRYDLANTMTKSRHDELKRVRSSKKIIEKYRKDGLRNVQPH